MMKLVRQRELLTMQYFYDFGFICLPSNSKAASKILPASSKPVPPSTEPIPVGSEAPLANSKTLLCNGHPPLRGYCPITIKLT